MNERPTAILLIQCPDAQGFVAAVTGFLLRHGGNVVDLDEHVDREAGMFFMRVEWELAGFALERNAIGAAFAGEIADPLGMRWSLHFTDEVQRLAVLVSRLPHHRARRGAGHASRQSRGLGPERPGAREDRAGARGVRAFAAESAGAWE
jgi:formyltetrahydrofolate hydrolase